ncbi:MAG: DUF2252 domain-containing protein [Vicinamibacterales bacterium]
MDVVERIQRFNLGRDPERLAMKYANMRGDAFIFLRASCHLYYDRLPDAAVLCRAPAVWACGDLHLENFGSYKGDNRQVYFDLNDFDESVLAPATWDVVRFLSSVVVGRHSLAAGRTRARELCERFLAAYSTALAIGQARWLERETAPSPVAELLRSLRDRRRVDLLDSRTVRKGKRRRLRVDGRKALSASEDQQARVTAAIERCRIGGQDAKFFTVLDVARRIAGNGSLGQDRYVVLVRGRGHPDGNFLFDLKAAPRSSLAGHTPLTQPRWPNEAERVVAIQRRVQAIPPAFLHTLTMGGTAYVLRDLQPSQDRVELARSRGQRRHADHLMAVMGQCVAWAHLRAGGRQGSATADALIDFGKDSRWHRPVLDAARAAAAQVEADWATFAEAYDDGAFDV